MLCQVGWVVGWLNILGLSCLAFHIHAVNLTLTITQGQIAGVSSTEFGLSYMIWAAVVIAKVTAARPRGHKLVD